MVFWAVFLLLVAPPSSLQDLVKWRTPLWSLSTRTRRNLVKCLQMRNKQTLNRSAFLVVKHMLMVRNVVWMRRRRRVPSLNRRKRRKVEPE